MANVDKKRAKLKERIAELEAEMKLSLQKKSSGTAAFDVPSATRQIAKLRAELASLK
jgi:ribosome-interacting GTPase 1